MSKGVRVWAALPLRSILVTLLGTAALGACGGSAPPPAPPKAQAAPKEAPTKPKGKFAMSGQLGSLDEGKVNETFATLVPRFDQCLSQGSSRVEFLGGHVKFAIRIALDGAAKWAYLSESTLGDRDTERCMLDVAKGARWPIPEEGEGQAQRSFDFDPSPDVRDAVPWGADRISKALASARAKLGQCAHRAPGKYHATVYVQTNGTPMAAGVAPPDERGEPGSVDCMVDVIKSMRFPSPGSWPAKVSFAVD
jgi:hypothetical protein